MTKIKIRTTTRTTTIIVNNNNNTIDNMICLLQLITHAMALYNKRILFKTAL